MKWTDALHLAGSIASISGISLLWLRTALPDVKAPGLIAGSISTIVGALVSVGIITLAIEAMAKRAPNAVASHRTKIIYWSFSASAALAAVSLLMVYLWSAVWVAWSLQ